ncbi:alpha/beta hydrolase [Arthrobacter oryzae]|uniref:alpha/beta fold hydrolase n=1 Tax=Arthrobacter oryzae TaxID=409290 RepID=UPI0028620298|nr:alpha/beta hydrolase [Arthrobacter oryzae]MDR6507309.1 pimeloyl-ACP methyl ester carboxylesterase [Arthrobacter oryzae]
MVADCRIESRRRAVEDRRRRRQHPACQPEQPLHLGGGSGRKLGRRLRSSLAFAAKHPDRLLSLALLEPAWAGNWDWRPAHTELWKVYERLEDLPPEQFTPAFMRLGVKRDVVLPPPPPGPPPPWMAKRPAGIRAFLRTFKSYDLDRARLAAFRRPVLFVLGGLSNPDEFGDIAGRLSRVFFPDFRLEVFPKRHHFDPPHRIEPERLAELLRAYWERAEGRSAASAGS